VPEIGEQVEVVFEWDRDIRYSGTVEQTAPIVVHVSGQPDDMSRLHLTEWAWIQHGQILAIESVSWGATSADRRKSARPPWASRLEDRRKLYGCVAGPGV
jgi:hypothetical protein